MDIRGTIDRNYKLIGFIILVIIFVLFIIKILDSYYVKVEKEKLEQYKNSLNVTNNQIGNIENIEENYMTESNSIEITMMSFVNFCNKREIENAYKMLTEECKTAMFPTINDFEEIYVEKIYNIKRYYELTKWEVTSKKYTYQVKLYGNILETANINDYVQEYYTFIEDENGNYKLNINNYIYGEDKNIKSDIENLEIEVKIGHVDVYEEYEEVNFKVTNTSSKTICLTGNKDVKNIYLQNSDEIKYSSLNSKFDNEEIIIKPSSTKQFTIKFNKSYSAKDKEKSLVLSNVILDYDDYLKSSDQANYANRTTIKVEY